MPKKSTNIKTYRMAVRRSEGNTGENATVPILMLAQTILLYEKKKGGALKLPILKSYLKDVDFKYETVLRQTFVSYIFLLMITAKRLIQ